MKAGWTSETVGSLAAIQNGFAFDSKQFSNTAGIPLIRIRDLKNGSVTETNYEGEYDQRYEVIAGDFLIGMDGEFGCYQWNGDKALLNQRVCRLHQFSKKLDPKFLFYGINKHLKEIEDTTTYTTVKHISSKQIANIRFLLPPLHEQQRIIAILDEAFARLTVAITNAEKNLKNARELFDSYLSSVFTLKGEGWVKKKFEDCLEDVKYTTKIKRRDFLNEEKFPIISQEADFVNGYWSQSKDVFKLKKPVVIFGDHTKVLKYVDFDFVLGADGVKILQPKAMIESKFFYYALKNLPLVSRGYARHYSVLKETNVSYPSEKRSQKVIAGKLDNLQAECEHLEETYRKQLTSLAELKQSILQKAFSGELGSPPSGAIKEAAE